MQLMVQSITRNILSLGMVLLAVFCLLMLFNRADSNCPFKLKQTAGAQPLNLFLYVLPIGPLFNKINDVFHSDGTQDTQVVSDSMTGYAKAMAAEHDKEKIKSILLAGIRTLVNPQFIDLYFFDAKGQGYLCENDQKQNKLLPNLISLESNLIPKIGPSSGILSITDEIYKFQTLEGSQFEISDSISNLLVPIEIQSKLVGWLVLGPPKEAQVYTREDINIIELLTHLFSMAYEKTELLKNHQKELAQNQLQRQLVNIVNGDQNFDQVLANIFSHLQETLAINEFSIILRSPESFVSKILYSIQGDQPTITSNKPKLLKGEFLEKEIIATGKIKQVEENGSWLILPLVLNEQIIGALNMGNAQKKGVFEAIDLSFFHFLAGAVSNATQIHLLKQANHTQNQQLNEYNKFNEQLTSNKNLKSLLGTILDAAMNLLNCTSGALIVIDEDQDELVFEVAAGPMGAIIQGERLPSNAGIAGQTFITGKPTISNQIDQTTPWFSKNYPQAETPIENVLSVPIIAEDQVLGILELINKDDHLPFNENDLQILERYANQAAVVLHQYPRNSETDQALQAQIEELKTMQQIDRDLNTIQDINRALQKLLNTALQHTSARYGTIGLVDLNTKVYERLWQIRPADEAPRMLDDVKLHGETWFDQENKYLKMLQSPDLSSSFEISDVCQWHYLVYSELEDDQALLLILHTEASEQLTRQDRAFLARLKEHSTIALNNALLYEELHGAIQAKNDFIGFISHELKNPLTVIKGYADILRKGMAGEVNDEQIDYLSTINHNVKRMDKFIKDLSDQSHIETKSLTIEFEATPVREVVNEVLQSYESQIKTKSLKILLNVPGNLPNVWCDRLRLIQILANLISNAIKYTPPNRQIKISAEQSVNIWDEKGTAEVIHFWVTDEGYGISQEDQEHLFEKFYRGSNVRIRKIPGTGLGLRISKSLVEMMGGKMWFKSILDEGSSFHFTLPI